MAISTYPITLKAGGTKLCDIKGLPRSGGAPESGNLPRFVTRPSIAGIQDSSRRRVYADTAVAMLKRARPPHLLLNLGRTGERNFCVQRNGFCVYRWCWRE